MPITESLYCRQFRNSLATPVRESPPFPAHMRLYPDTDRLIWSGNALLVAQRDLRTRSPLVHMLLEQLHLVVRFVAYLGRQDQAFTVEELSFTLDASAPVYDNVRKYSFNLTYPVSGGVRIEEVLDERGHRWRHYISVRGQTTAVRDVSDGVNNFAAREERRMLANKQVRRVNGTYERELDL